MFLGNFTSDPNDQPSWKYEVFVDHPYKSKAYVISKRLIVLEVNHIVIFIQCRCQGGSRCPTTAIFFCVFSIIINFRENPPSPS